MKPLGKEIFNFPAGIVVWRGDCAIPNYDDGPAIIFPNGDMEWWRNGELHRDDGPAVMRGDGSHEWWLQGQPWPEGQIEAENNLMSKARRHAMNELKKHRRKWL